MPRDAPFVVRLLVVIDRVADLAQRVAQFVFVGALHRDLCHRCGEEREDRQDGQRDQQFDQREARYAVASTPACGSTTGARTI
jgi:hypothetical protein